MAPARTEFIGKETKAQGGEIRSPRSAEQVARACWRAGPLPCLSGKREDSCVLPRRRGLTYAFLFLSGKKRKSTQRGEEPPEPGSFPLRLKAGLKRSRADKTGSRPGLGRLLSSLASRPCGQGASLRNSGGSQHPPHPTILQPRPS